MTTRNIDESRRRWTDLYGCACGPWVPAWVEMICRIRCTGRAFHRCGGARGRGKACGSCTHGRRRCTCRLWNYCVTLSCRGLRSMCGAPDRWPLWNSWCSLGTERGSHRSGRRSGASPTVFHYGRRSDTHGSAARFRRRLWPTAVSGVRSPLPLLGARGVGSCVPWATPATPPCRIGRTSLWAGSCAPCARGGAICRWICNSGRTRRTWNSSPNCGCTCAGPSTCDDGSACRSVRSTGSSPFRNWKY